ncbi:MAG: flagellar motor switch protein FliG [Zetaproteobacteria bacterium]|nr:MAG: flagellar motor switch protein FliG [Zetaproteobacteria bacterium]
MKSNAKLSGLDKTALLLYALGPEASAPIVRDLDNEILIRLGQRMSDLGKIEAETLHAVVQEYLDMHHSDDPLLRSSRKDVLSLLKYAMDEERSAQVLAGLDAPRKLSIWEKLSRLKPEMIKPYVENEHPQTVALILGNIESSVASRVIALLPEDMQMSVVVRMSKIETVPSDLVRDIEETLEEELSGMEGSSGLSFDGMVNVVDILKKLDKSVAKPILERLQEKDEELFQQVDRLLLVFEDLNELSDRDIQSILKHISSDDLVKALKGASDEIADSFFGNMSKRAAEIMREDMEVMGPLKLADVEESQQNILKTVRKLDDEGAITLGGNEEMV